MPEAHTKNFIQNISLLGNTSRIETPFVTVTFGDLKSGYQFGVFMKDDKNNPKIVNGMYQNSTKYIYPNYIKSLQINKINGQVNQYTLSIIYPIRPGDDPNFFEKVFGKISQTRKIFFTYGDWSVPDYVYRNEQAIITGITSQFDLRSSSISYTVSAVSSAALGLSGCHTFPGGLKQPSAEIYALLNNPIYGLSDIFYGMRGKTVEELQQLGLLAGDDRTVTLNTQENISTLDYLKYLVSCMIPIDAPLDSNNQNTFYILTVHDDVLGESTNNVLNEVLGGPYFKISRLTKNIKNTTDAYELTIGAPSKDIIMNFSLSDNETYSIYYNWQSDLTQSDYKDDIDDNGELIKIYAPNISSKNDEHKTRAADKIWWSKITEYPISATVTIKGLLRPATLMQYVKMQVLFYGKKHISSGLYIVTRQTDLIDQSGYRTTLNLTRVAGESEEEYVM